VGLEHYKRWSEHSLFPPEAFPLLNSLCISGSDEEMLFLIKFLLEQGLSNDHQRIVWPQLSRVTDGLPNGAAKQI